MYVGFKLPKLAHVALVVPSESVMRETEPLSLFAT